MNIDIIVGARPNFIKIAVLIKNLQKKIVDTSSSFRIIHTGQHYDYLMSGVFFNDLFIPEPDVFLNCGGGSYAEQLGKIMVGYEKLLELDNPLPDICIVVGDVNSTVACTIVAKKFQIKVAHIEAGIRSHDMSMPEEINRILTDSITDLFFTTSSTANKNLIKRGVPKKSIFFVGNTMIDTLLENINNLKEPNVFQAHNLKRKSYLVLTIHRPSNVDSVDSLIRILTSCLENSFDYKIVFPIHPRTKLVLDNIGYINERLIVIDPLSYLEFIFLLKNSIGIITDSGGITEEATVLNIPTITLRENTERPETVSIGSNVLVGTSCLKLKRELKNIFDNKFKLSSIPPMWDGKATERIVDIIFCNI
jgi:UDP-N-acetylglucosamine 2-epimerase (non-hydrolysing)